MTNCAKAAGMPLCFLVLMLWASRTRAEITVIRKNTFSDPLLSPLSLKIAGSIRPEFVWDRSATHDLRRHGHDGGSRFRFTAGYQLTPALSVVGRYLWGVDLAHVLGLKHHYNPHQHWDIQRQMFGGIALRHVGQLTYGHQHGVYYDVIGSKSDIWDFDGNASANWIGVPGDYGGGDRPRNAFKYKNTLGRYTLYADYLLPQHAAPLADDRHYQRRHGEGIGVDYQARRDLTLSAAWDQTNATVTDARGERRHYRQHFSGAVRRCAGDRAAGRWLAPRPGTGTMCRSAAGSRSRAISPATVTDWRRFLAIRFYREKPGCTPCSPIWRPIRYACAATSITMPVTLISGRMSMSLMVFPSTWNTPSRPPATGCRIPPG
ncbi:porin [Erwinia persicina]|uniref:porin n=1 Tax=Erwinia persicina TaxID=55211 RepID=UPI00178181CA|nr:porin [Erwinia persicina]MBD8162763.1 porin [Erwinia persicina]